MNLLFEEQDFAPHRDGDRFFMVARDWLCTMPVGIAVAYLHATGVEPGEVDKLDPPDATARQILDGAALVDGTAMPTERLAWRARHRGHVHLIGREFDPSLVRMGLAFARYHRSNVVHIGAFATGVMSGITGDIPPDVESLVMRGHRWVLVIAPMNLAAAMPTQPGGVA